MKRKKIKISKNRAGVIEVKDTLRYSETSLQNRGVRIYDTSKGKTYVNGERGLEVVYSPRSKNLGIKKNKNKIWPKYRLNVPKKDTKRWDVIDEKIFRGLGLPYKKSW